MSQTPPPSLPPYPQKSPISQPGLRSPVVAAPNKPSSKEEVQRQRRTGCTIGVIALLVVVVFAYVGYLTINFFVSRLSGTGGGFGPIATPTLAPVTTTPIKATLTYAGVDITIIDVQQSASFPDDVNLISAPGEVRLDIREHNTVAHAIGNFTYREAAHIILPTSKSVSPVNADNFFAPESTTPRTNWLDFSVPTKINVGELLLRLGKAGEAQMDVLLRPNVDVSRYHSKTIKPHITLHYHGLNWTIKSARESWSVGNQQASAGMLYLTLTLVADNPASQTFNALPANYMQLKAGGTTDPPTVDSTFPPSIGAATTGTTGTAVFLVPQNTSSYTFILLADPTSQALQVSADFQIQ